ncbi:MAG TPA: BrnT family toxin [Stellaceae bacterium]
MTEFEYDPAKNDANLQKHGIDFDQARRIWQDIVVEFQDSRFNYGEQRMIALGRIDGRVIVAVYTWRGKARRLISARKANSNERKIYQAALAGTSGDA